MSRWLVFVIGAAVAAIAALWAVRPLAPQRDTAAATSMTERPVTTGRDLTTRLGVDVPASAATVTAAATAGRFKLVGVVANGSEGVALIAVDGQPARAFRVGAAVEGDIVVRQTSAGGAILGPRGGGAVIALEVSLTPAPAPGPTTALAPVPTARSGSVPRGLMDGSDQSQDILRKLGSRHPPLSQPTLAVPQKPGGGIAPAVDDGSWKPPSGQ